MDFQDIKPKELSEKTGISVNTIRKYINGHNALPNIHSAVKIAKALNTTVEELIEEKASKAIQSNATTRKYTSLFSELSENDQKSVIALMSDMRKHY